MNEDVKRQALEEAQRTYKGFLSVAKKFSIVDRVYQKLDSVE